MPPKTRFQYRHQYEPEADEREGAAAAVEFTEPSLTQQQFTDEVNINVMMERMGVRDGAIPAAAFDPKLFGTVSDFGAAIDLRDVFDRVHAARDLFEQLPADIRRRFGHNPAQMLDFLNDPENVPEAVRLGLLHEKKADPPPPPPDGGTKPPAAS